MALTITPKLDPQISKIYAKGGQRSGKKAGRICLHSPRPASFSATGRFIIS